MWNKGKQRSHLGTSRLTIHIGLFFKFQEQLCFLWKLPCRQRQKSIGHGLSVGTFLLIFMIQSRAVKLAKKKMDLALAWGEESKRLGHGCGKAVEEVWWQVFNLY